MATKTVTLDPGEGQEVAFGFIPDVAKVYAVSINGLSGSFRAIEAPQPAEFVVSNLFVSPGTVSLGEIVTIRFDVTNVGGLGRSSIYFRLKGPISLGAPIYFTLDSGQTITHSVPLTPTKAGIYTVTVDSLSATFTTTTVPPTPPTYCNKAAFDAAYGSKVGDPNYNPTYDFNGDGKIDIFDFVTFADICGKYL